MANNQSQLSFEQPRSAFGTWVGVVLLFAVFGLFVLVVVRAVPRGDTYEEKRAAARMEKLKTASDEASAALHSYGWVDKEKGIARIPIDRAMELSVAELAQKKPAPAGPIATPSPEPVAAAPEAPKPTPAAAPPAPAPATAATPAQSPPAAPSPAPAATP